MKIAIYSRKSVYTGKGESIANQIQICKEYVLNRKDIFQIQDETKDFYIFQDEGFSGKNFSRPQFQDMMKLVRAKKIDCIVCYRLDRISRSVSDFAPLMEELNKLGVAFVSVNEQFDTSTSMGRAMILMSSVFAQLERETIAERVKDNYYQLAQTGRWLGGNPPLGYNSHNIHYETIDGKKKQSTYLEINEDEIQTVRLIFDKYVVFRSFKKVADYLYQNGIKTRVGKAFTSATVRDILLNPLYCIADSDIYDYMEDLGTMICMPKEKFTGEFALISNYRRDHTKKNAPRLPMKQWMVSVGKHKGIITGKEWILVLHYMNINHKTIVRTAANRNEYALLSGKIICKKCGNKLFAKMSSYGGLFYYICSGKRSEAKYTHEERCTCENLPGKEVDKLVLEKILSYATNIEDWDKVLKHLEQKLQHNEIIEKINAIEANIDEKNAKIQKYIDQILEQQLNDILVAEINKRVDHLSEEIGILDEKRKQLLLQLDTAYKNIAHDQEMFLATAAYLSKNIDVLTMEEKREIIDLLVDYIEWDGEQINIFIYGQP